MKSAPPPRPPWRDSGTRADHALDPQAGFSHCRVFGEEFACPILETARIMSETSQTPKPSSHEPPGDWWARWFNETYAEVYNHRDLESARREMEFAAQSLRLNPDHRILDLCCGNGRHTRAAAEAGLIRTIGMDYSNALLRQARTAHGVKRILRGDMRALPFPNAFFDALVMFFTSFGYFENQPHDMTVLREIARVLANGGGCLIDYLNPCHLRNTLVPHSEKRIGNRRIIEERSLVNDGRRVRKNITIETEGKIERFTESVRLYESGAMIELLAGVGLEPDSLYGDFDGQPFGDSSPRMILVRSKSP